MCLQVYYRMHLTPSVKEKGLTLTTEYWLALHATKHYHFCIAKADHNAFWQAPRPMWEMPMDTIKRLGLTVKRIRRAGSTFAADTRQGAFALLQRAITKVLKRGHPDYRLMQAFVDKTRGKQLADLPHRLGDQMFFIPDTQAVVEEHFRREQPRTPAPTSSVRQYALNN